MTHNTTTQTDFQKQAADFAKKHGIKLTIGSPSYGFHFVGDKEERYIFPCKLTRNGKSYSFKFGQSLHDQDKEPTMYDVLSCLTKYEPGDFDEFCNEFGYYPINSSADYRAAQKMHKAVCKEWKGVNNLFTDILDELQEIA
jgi:hypothetical protein